MPRKRLEVELHIEPRPEPSAAWDRLFSWLLSAEKNGPDAEGRGRQKSQEDMSRDAESR